MSETVNHGNRSEQILHELTSFHFLSDFVFPNPPYFKGPHKRELADMLVMLDDTLLLFQIKSHQSKPDSPHNLNRAQRKVYEAFRQFRVLIEASESMCNAELTNHLGIAIPFNIKSFKSIYLICVIDFIQDESAQAVHFRTTGYNEHDLPIFCFGFEAEDLYFLLHQCDTIPDFTAFLSSLALLENNAPVSLDMNYLDLLAFTRLYPFELLSILDGAQSCPHLEPGIGVELIKRGAEFEMEESYLVDDIIAWLHSSIGSSFQLPKRKAHIENVKANSAESYWMIAGKLASMPRNKRQLFAGLITRKRTGAIEREFSYGAMEDAKCAYLVHSSVFSRENRVREVGGLCLALLATRPNLDQVIGLAFPPAGQNEGEYEAIVIKREWCEDLSDLKSEVLKHEIFEPAPSAGLSNVL